MSFTNSGSRSNCKECIIASVGLTGKKDCSDSCKCYCHKPGFKVVNGTIVKELAWCDMMYEVENTRSNRNDL